MLPCRSDIWLVNLDPTIGEEIRKTRPAVVVSRDALGVLALRVIVPITGWQERFAGCEWLVRLESDAATGLAKTSAADTFQVRSISSRRFERKIGQVSDEAMGRIVAGLRTVLEM